MIIDSHAHYSHGVYQKPFRYLTMDENGFALKEGELDQLLQELTVAGINASVEPGISMESCDRILELSHRYPNRIFPAMGVHPTRCIYEKWSDRKKLAEYASITGVIAIGETGLDYHHAREDQHRLKQHLWFFYQLRLAQKLKKPLILHVRDAHKDALRILKRHPARKFGGVIHCFNSNWEVAERYVKLGYHLGIGGSILQQEDRAGELWEAVSRIPLEQILIETDAPFILPYCKDVLPPKLLRRTRNTSMILPEIIRKIAQIKNIPVDRVEQITTENAIRLFRLNVH